MSALIELPADVDKALLEVLFIGRDPEAFWDIDFSESESEGSHFRRTGVSGVICTGYAFEIHDRLTDPGRVKIYGFSCDENPLSEIAQLAGGHDFVVIDDRFIVDPWWADVEKKGAGVYDLLAPQDLPTITRLYGSVSRWEQMQSGWGRPYEHTA